MFISILRRTTATAALAAAFAVATADMASAHECYIASRSDTGNTKAGSVSQAWYTLNVAQAIAEDPALTSDQVSCIQAAYAATGAPASFTIHVKGATGQDGVLADNNPNKALMTNGKGVDHAFDAYGEQIFGSYEACGVSF